MVTKFKDIFVHFPGVMIIHQKIPSHEVGRHTHEGHEFFLPLQGEIKVEHNHKFFKAGPGRMLYVPPKIDHRFSSTSQGSGERVICLIQDELWKKQSTKKFPTLSMPCNSLAKELLFHLLIHPKIEGVKYFISALIQTLIESIQGAGLQQNHMALQHLEGKIGDERIKKSIQILDVNISGISMDELSKESGLSQRNLSRLFLKETGITPKEYLILIRMDKARKLLKETPMTITDIALEVGYNSLSKFIETFKKIVGKLPSDYRNE